MGRRLALLIATYQYQDVGLRRLTAPEYDAESLAAVLRDPEIAGFEVRTLVNEPHHVVGEAIGDFYRDRRRDDLTLLYFTGHGLKDDDGRLYLAMTNTRRESLLFTSMPAEQIDQAMEGCASRQKVLILDCCYSGAYPAGRLAKADSQVHALERFQGRGRTVLTASDATQYSFEGNELHGEAARSVFTRYLVAGLRDGSADLDGDGDITLDELYSYVHDRVVDEMPQQRPKKQDNVEGRTVIARNVNWSMPTYLSNAISSPIATDRLGAVDALVHLYRIGNDTVRARAVDEVRRLAEDDSRMVSAAAMAQLRAIAPPSPSPSPSPSSPPPSPEGARVGVAGSERMAGQAVDTAEPSTAVAAAVAAPAERVTERVVSRWIERLRRLDLLALATGVLAIVAAGLLVTGIVVRELTHRFVPGFALEQPWYTLGLAAVILAAGVTALVPRTRSLVGPGVVMGVAAASTWGLAYWAGRLTLDSGNPVYWIEAGGHLAPLCAAVLAGLVVRRGGAARIEPRLPRDALTRVAAVLVGVGAVVGALALAGEAYQISRLAEEFNQSWSGRQLAGDARAYAVAAVVALNLPLWAAVLSPRKLGVSILTGWIGGGSAVCLTTFLSHPDRVWGVDGYERGPTLATVFGSTLVLLVVAVGLTVRRPTRHLETAPAISGRWRATVLAGLATLSVVTAMGAIVAVRAAEPLALTRTEAVDVAVSPDGSRVYVLARVKPWRSDDAPSPGQVVVLDPETNAAVSEPIPVGSDPLDIATSSNGEYLYIANHGSDNVSVISTLENASVGDPIPVGSGPRRIFTGANEQLVYVVNGDDDTVSVIDTRAYRVIGPAIQLGDESWATVVSPDGSRIYTSNGGAESGPYFINVLSTDTGESLRDPIPVSDEPAAIAVSPDGRQVYVLAGSADQDRASMSTLNAETFEVDGTGSIPSDIRPDTMTVSPDNRRIYVPGLYGGVVVVDTNTRAMVGAPLGHGHIAVAVSPDGQWAYTAGFEDTVSAFRTADPGTVTTIELTTD
jgi:YVTN family beta-propeller protein